MIEEVDEKTLDKLRKLMAMRDGAGTTQEEANAFAEKVARMLIDLKLKEHEVHDHFDEKESERQRMGDTPVDFSNFDMKSNYYHRRIGWTERLGRVIADNYFCDMAVCKGSNTLLFAGRQMDREVAVFVYVTLARAAIKMCDHLQKVKELVRHITDKPLDLRNFREGFYDGFVDGIRDRLRSMRQKVEEENPQYALIRQKSVEELEAWAEQNYVAISGGPGMADLRGTLGYAAGKEFAKDVPIETAVRGAAPRKLVK